MTRSTVRTVGNTLFLYQPNEQGKLQALPLDLWAARLNRANRLPAKH